MISIEIFQVRWNTDQKLHELLKMEIDLFNSLFLNQQPLQKNLYQSSRKLRKKSGKSERNLKRKNESLKLSHKMKKKKKS